MNNEILTRECEVRVDQNTTYRRVIRVSFSSQTPVIRKNSYSEAWIETLGHDENEVNLSRLNTGAPVLYNHERGSSKHRIGVVERVWLESGKGYADLRISKRAEVEGIWQDIQDGILRNEQIISCLKDTSKVWDELFLLEQARLTRLFIRKVIIKPTGINIQIYNEGLHLLKNELTHEAA